MSKGFLCATLLLCIGMIGCIGLAHVPSRQIAAIPAGAQEQLSLKVDLPKHSASWEIGLWPSAGATNIADLGGKHLVARLTNVSDRKLSLTPGVGSAFEKRLIVAPGQSVVVSDAVIKSHAQMTSLFGCDTHEHGVSFQLNLQFRPPVQIQEPINVRARGRDAL
jgi:hypothetical protein